MPALISDISWVIDDWRAFPVVDLGDGLRPALRASPRLTTGFVEVIIMILRPFQLRSR